MEENFNQNQTQFAVDEPVLEKPIEPVAEEQAALPTKKKLPKYAYFIIGGGVFILIILIVAVFNRPQQQVEEEAGITPTPTVVREMSPIEQKLQVAKDELEESNPTTEKYPFPPLNMELRIDDAR